MFRDNVDWEGRSRTGSFAGGGGDVSSDCAAMAKKSKKVRWGVWEEPGSELSGGVAVLCLGAMR